MGFRPEATVCVEEYTTEESYIVRLPPSYPRSNIFIPFAPRSLAPGANNLLKSLAGPDVPPNKRVDVNKTVKMLTLDDWQLIMQAFEEWPFAPDVS